MTRKSVRSGRLGLVTLAIALACAAGCSTDGDADADADPCDPDALIDAAEESLSQVADDSIHQLEICDDAVLEEWERLTSEPDARAVWATHLDHEEWSWLVTIAAMEFVREDPLEQQLRDAIRLELERVPGVSEVQEEDREVWVIQGTVNGPALVEAAARAVDPFADEILAFIDAIPSEGDEDLSTADTGDSSFAATCRQEAAADAAFGQIDLSPSSCELARDCSSGVPVIEVGTVDDGLVVAIPDGLVVDSDAEMTQVGSLVKVEATEKVVLTLRRDAELRIRATFEPDDVGSSLEYTTFGSDEDC